MAFTLPSPNMTSFTSIYNETKSIYMVKYAICKGLNVALGNSVTSSIKVKSPNPKSYPPILLISTKTKQQQQKKNSSILVKQSYVTNLDFWGTKSSPPFSVFSESLYKRAPLIDFRVINLHCVEKLIAIKAPNSTDHTV